jgi:hypothetical protein
MPWGGGLEYARRNLGHSANRVHPSQQGAVQTVAPNGANQPFNEGMGSGTYGTVLISLTSRMRRFRLPLAEPIQGIMVRAEIFGEDWPRVARLNIRHNFTRCTAKPTMRRVHWSITTSTQCAQDDRFDN